MLTPIWASSLSIFRLVQGGHGVDQGHAAAGDDAFFNRRAGGGKGIFHAVLLFLQLGLGGCANADDGNAAGELGQAFLQFLAVVIAGALVDLDADLLDAAFDLGGIALAADDGGVVLGGDDLLGAAEVGDGGGFQLAAGLFGDHLGAGQDGDILQHGLAAVAKAGGFDGQDIEHAAQFVQHQGRQGFAVDVLGDDHQVALADLDQFLQEGDDIG